MAGMGVVPREPGMFLIVRSSEVELQIFVSVDCLCLTEKLLQEEAEEQEELTAQVKTEVAEAIRADWAVVVAAQNMEEMALLLREVPSLVTRIQARHATQARRAVEVAGRTVEVQRALIQLLQVETVVTVVRLLQVTRLALRQERLVVVLEPEGMEVITVTVLVAAVVVAGTAGELEVPIGHPVEVEALHTLEQ